MYFHYQSESDILQCMFFNMKSDLQCYVIVIWFVKQYIFINDCFMCVSIYKKMLYIASNYKVLCVQNRTVYWSKKTLDWFSKVENVHLKVCYVHWSHHVQSKSCFFQVFKGNIALLYSLNKWALISETLNIQHSITGSRNLTFGTKK